MPTLWLRRGDGTEFEVPEGSVAHELLLAAGARPVVHAGDPDENGSSTETGDTEGSDLTYADLRARAKELDLPAKGTADELRTAIAAEEARRAAADADSESDPDETGSGTGD
jgi:hypothetical protein